MYIIQNRKLKLFDCFQARLDILKIHSRKMNLTRGINLRKIAEMMPGASGAEVKVSADTENCDQVTRVNGYGLRMLF